MNFSTYEKSRAKDAPKSKIVIDVLISPHLRKSKGGIQKKDGASKILLSDLEKWNPKSTLIEISNGELPHLSSLRVPKFHDSRNAKNRSEESLPKQSNSLKIEDTSRMQKKDASSHCESESIYDGLNVEAGSPLEGQVVEKAGKGVVEEVHLQMNNLSNK